MAGFADRLAAAKAKQGEAQERKTAEASAAEAAETAKREREGKKSELTKSREGVQAELSKTESTAKEAESAIVEADAFLKEQGEGMDAEAKAEIDALKAEASETLKKFDALKADLAKIDAEIATLETAEESPEKTEVVEAALVEQPTEAAPESGVREHVGLAEVEAKEKPPYNEKELQKLAAHLEKIRGKGKLGSADVNIGLLKALEDIKNGVSFEKGGPEAMAMLGAKGAEMLNKFIDEEVDAIYAIAKAKGAEYLADFYHVYEWHTEEQAKKAIKAHDFSGNEDLLKDMKDIENMRNEKTRSAAIAEIRENPGGNPISQSKLNNLLATLEHDPNLKKTFVEELGPEAMEMYKARE